MDEEDNKVTDGRAAGESQGEKTKSGPGGNLCGGKVARRPNPPPPPGGGFCYAWAMPEPLSINEVRHVAKLARLSLTDEQIDEYRSQLSTILEHIAMLEELDLEGVEPMAHPLDVTNRLDEDEVGPSLPIEALLANAPAMEDRFLAVPKVLGGQEGGGA